MSKALRSSYCLLWGRQQYRLEFLEFPSCILTSLALTLFHKVSISQRNFLSERWKSYRSTIKGKSSQSSEEPSSETSKLFIGLFCLVLASFGHKVAM